MAEIDPVAKMVEEQVRRGGMEALENIAREILEASRRDAPIGDPNDSKPPGFLRASGHINKIVDGREHDDWRGGLIEIEFDAAYAAKQHEELTYKHPRGGKAKYLEDNVKKALPTLEAKFASSIRGKLGSLKATGLVVSVTRGAGGRFARAGSPGAVTAPETWSGGGALLR